MCFFLESASTLLYCCGGFMLGCLVDMCCILFELWFYRWAAVILVYAFFLGCCSLGCEFIIFWCLCIFFLEFLQRSHRFSGWYSMPETIWYVLLYVSAVSSAHSLGVLLSFEVLVVISFFSLWVTWAVRRTPRLAGSIPSPFFLAILSNVTGILAGELPARFTLSVYCPFCLILKGLWFTGFSWSPFIHLLLWFRMSLSIAVLRHAGDSIAAPACLLLNDSASLAFHFHHWCCAICLHSLGAHVNSPVLTFLLRSDSLFHAIDTFSPGDAASHPALFLTHTGRAPVWAASRRLLRLPHAFLSVVLQRGYLAHSTRSADFIRSSSTFFDRPPRLVV